MKERELIKLLKENNADAFKTLYNNYWNKVYSFTRLYILSVEDSKEVTQEVFVRLWETREQINENENFKGYLFIITRNIVFNYNKKHFNNNLFKAVILNAFTEVNIKDNCNIEEEVAANQLSEFIDGLINQLPERQKEIFILNRKEHLTYKEIAERLQISPKTVEANVSKALKFLKENINIGFIFFLLS